MKSFSQFLQESYFSEEIPAGMSRAQYNALPAQSRRRLGGSNAAYSKKGQPLQGSASAPAIRSARQGMSGQQAAAVTGVTAAGGAATLAANGGDNPAKSKLDNKLDSDIKTTKVKSPARKPGNPWNWFPKKPEKQYGIPKEGPSSRLPNRTLAPAGGTSTRPALPPSGSTAKPAAIVRATPSTPAAKPIQQIKTDLNVPTPKGLGGSKRQLALPAAGQTSGSKSPALSGGGKSPSGPKIKVPAGAGRALKVAGKLVGPASAALDVADERSKGSGWARSLAKGAAVAAGGALGGAAGSVAGPVGTIGGATAGSIAASKAFDTAAGANAKERKAMATANRQRQAGSSIKGIGGKTTFDTKKNTMTTGVGSQRKTVGLAKTGVVQRGGQSVAGNLAYKGGQAVYKAGPSAQSLAKTSSNPLERIGRSLFAGAYKKSDAANAAKKLATARASDVARNKALGVKMKPGG